MFELDFELIASWPKLAWAAVMTIGDNHAKVLHGPMVEVRKDWLVEGVWDGPFQEGNFDLSDLVFGSDVRKRENNLVFVSSATGVDRLWYVSCENQTYVSNSLPGLLSAAGLSLRNDYQKYFEELMTVETKGVKSCVDKIPSDGPDIHLVYYKNLLWNSEVITEVEKADNAPEFNNFKFYETYLRKTAEAIGQNSRSSQRNFRIEMLVARRSNMQSNGSFPNRL